MTELGRKAATCRPVGHGRHKSSSRHEVHQTLKAMVGRRSRILIIGASIAIVTTAHCTTPLDRVPLHVIYQRLYYLPILAGAFWFGRKGALLTSALSAASYFPHVVTDWSQYTVYRETQYAELVMFQVVGIVVVTLVEGEKRQREKQKLPARELAGAYRQLQESFDQLQRADRLSALGQLSAGLAHEIKNPLASLRGSLEILASDFPEGHRKREFIEIVQKELRRLNNVLSKFLQFARTPKPDRHLCNLREVVDSIQTLCSNEASRQGVDIQTSYADDLPDIFRGRRANTTGSSQYRPQRDSGHAVRWPLAHRRRAQPGFRPHTCKRRRARDTAGAPLQGIRTPSSLRRTGAPVWAWPLLASWYGATEAISAYWTQRVRGPRSS